jgi:FkbM family methyltransferase
MLKTQNNKRNLTLYDDKIYPEAIEFCHEFIHSNRAKYILGRNIFADSIANKIEVNGYIDDFSRNSEYKGKPILKMEDVPENSLVVSSVIIGKPLTAEKRLAQFKFKYLDYFSFYKYSGLNIEQVMFWDGFIEDFQINQHKYEMTYNLLSDSQSKQQYESIINFRLNYDLNFMRNFRVLEEQQYFEDFLSLRHKGEVFVDVGGFDGFTTEEFIKRCPQYASIFFFEPGQGNLCLARERLKNFKNIRFFPFGLSDKKDTLRFEINGSSSRISESGNIIIDVVCLDDIVEGNISFIKMDIEGAEGSAINGSKQTIKSNHPILAISAYHRSDDFWKIPEQILSIRNDYKLYFRHYTEGISESVMFFIPS